MKLDEYAQFDGIGLAELVAKGEVTAGELTLLATEAMAKVNPSVNAVLEIYEDVVEAASKGSESPSGPFAGVPFLRKDIYPEAGRLMESGSRGSAGLRLQASTAFYERLIRAGLVSLGRTAVPEHALASTTESAFSGMTRNPWDLEHIAGGSSGGAAAAVATGIVPLAHASDGGGSIRIPASCCGVVGLKPSRGRITGAPEDGEPLFGLATQLVVSRTVRDTAAALDISALPAAGDPFVIPQAPTSYLAALAGTDRPLKIACSCEAWSRYADVDPEVAAVTRRAASFCAEQGHHVVEDTPVFDADEMFEANLTLFSVATADGIEAIHSMLQRPVSGEFLEPVTLKWFELGKAQTGQDVLHALETRERICRTLGTFMADYDVIMTPTLAHLPPLLGVIDGHDPEISVRDWWSAMERLHPNLCVFNMTGLPAMSLPLGESASGLPIGVQLAGQFAQEHVVLQLAAELEQALPWIDRRPRVHVAS